MSFNSEILTDEQREEFSSLFYEKCPLNDFESPIPWGCPWYAQMPIRGETIEDMVNWYILDHINEIVEEVAIAKPS